MSWSAFLWSAPAGFAVALASMNHRAAALHFTNVAWYPETNWSCGCLQTSLSHFASLRFPRWLVAVASSAPTRDQQRIHAALLLVIQQVIYLSYVYWVGKHRYSRAKQGERLPIVASTVFDFLAPWDSVSNPSWEVEQGVQIWGHPRTRTRQTKIATLKSTIIPRYRKNEVCYAHVTEPIQNRPVWPAEPPGPYILAHRA